jgi:hypothetical protein
MISEKNDKHISNHNILFADIGRKLGDIVGKRYARLLASSKFCWTAGTKALL